MVATYSTMLPLGTKAPKFSLPNVVEDSTATLDHFPHAKAYVLAFVCNHCPFVKLIRDHLANFGNSALKKDVVTFAISSNDVESYPDDSPAKMVIEAKEAGYAFPYLYDESQEVAKSYNAACTPDFFLFDSNQRLAYRGQYDDARPGNGKPVTGNDLQLALDAVLAGKEVPEPHKPSIGCNIKWKQGNAPDYVG
jgi:peroxiredoxin